MIKKGNLKYKYQANENIELPVTRIIPEKCILELQIDSVVDKKDLKISPIENEVTIINNAIITPTIFKPWCAISSGAVYDANGQLYASSQRNAQDAYINDNPQSIKTNPNFPIIKENS